MLFSTFPCLATNSFTGRGRVLSPDSFLTISILLSSLRDAWFFTKRTGMNVSATRPAVRITSSTADDWQRGTAAERDEKGQFTLRLNPSQLRTHFQGG